jgi:hypothetical protein
MEKPEKDRQGGSKGTGYGTYSCVQSMEGYHGEDQLTRVIFAVAVRLGRNRFRLFKTVRVRKKPLNAEAIRDKVLSQCSGSSLSYEEKDPKTLKNWHFKKSYIESEETIKKLARSSIVYSARCL